jgi:hypothetical protein
MVNCEVGEDFAVDFDTGFVEGTHELRVRHTLKTSGSVDTLNPESAEVAFFSFTVAERVGQTFFPSVLCYCPNVFASTEVTSGELEDFFASVTRRYVVYRSWHNSKIIVNDSALPLGART